MEAIYDNIYYGLSNDNNDNSGVHGLSAMEMTAKQCQDSSAEYSYACTGPRPVASYNNKKKKKGLQTESQMQKAFAFDVSASTTSVASGYSQLSHSMHGK